MRSLLRIWFLGLTILFASSAANAQVVALGASNTAGKGVSSGDAYPAQLERLLKARGYAVTVSNAGISGDTTQGMLARLDSAAPQGTRVLILQPGGNDRRKGVASVVPQIMARLQARGMKIVMLENAMLHAIPSEMHQPDGVHLIPAGYHLLAERILPRVMAALGSRRG
ncbi:MAG TPA: GDSL-type esterase/lipase family protein [Bradyrhizobium sp.]|uniref:GDSL-type esterase/lipase family protein n=1 Tax=Bradyrhizobium sp. TaxID=376 RepID=UPI002B948B3B|nr:GDSL-type esterase/lipase family protein [Bradyrhizobium sp.]HLZ02163.1 GDSL-type esterase/lipase family protein [Bradyrhizobium sp.]